MLRFIKLGAPIPHFIYLFNSQEHGDLYIYSLSPMGFYEAGYPHFPEKGVIELNCSYC